MTHDIYDAVGAPVYHRLAANDVSEIPELLRLLRSVRGPVLELACGSGRITLPLLAAGHELTALDLSPAMIELLEARRAKLRRPDRLMARVGDMRDFALDARFDAIVLGTTSITLLSRAGRAACFASVRRHLTDGGRFFVSALDVDGAPSEAVHTFPGATLREVVDPVRGRREISVVLDGPGTVLTSAPYLLPSAILCDELARAGLEVVARHPVAGAEDRTVWLIECAP